MAAVKQKRDFFINWHKVELLRRTNNMTIFIDDVFYVKDVNGYRHACMLSRIRIKHLIFNKKNPHYLDDL